MQTDNNSNISNSAAEQNQTVKNEEKKSLFDKLDESKKKKSGIGNKINSFLEKFGKGFYIVRCICCFTTLFSTAAIVMVTLAGANSHSFQMRLGGFFFLIGIISSLLSCPGTIIMTALAIIGGGFTIGLSFIGIGCIIGLVIGLIIAICLAIYLPAAITIPYYFSELRHMKP